MALGMSCVTDAAYTEAASDQAQAIINQALADSAIQVGIALWQRNSSKSIANMQRDIANQQMILAEQVQAHAQIFWPEETELVNDAFAIAKVETQYVGLAGGWGALVDDAEATGRAIWLDVSRQLCYAPSRCDDARWQRNEQVLRADMVSYASRQDEARTEVLNDLRYEKQLAVLGLGRGKVASLVSYQGVGLFSGIQASQLIEGSVNSALKAYGYYPARDAAPTTGWAQGIRQTWARAPEPVVTRGLGADAPAATVTPLPPIPSAPSPAPVAPTSKLNEIEQGFNIAAGMGNFSTPYAPRDPNAYRDRERVGGRGDW